MLFVDVLHDTTAIYRIEAGRSTVYRKDTMATRCWRSGRLVQTDCLESLQKQWQFISRKVGEGISCSNASRGTRSIPEVYEEVAITVEISFAFMGGGFGESWCFVFLKRCNEPFRRVYCGLSRQAIDGLWIRDREPGSIQCAC